MHVCMHAGSQGMHACMFACMQGAEACSSAGQGPREMRPAMSTIASEGPLRSVP